MLNISNFGQLRYHNAISKSQPDASSANQTVEHHSSHSGKPAKLKVRHPTADYGRYASYTRRIWNFGNTHTCSQHRKLIPVIQSSFWPACITVIAPHGSIDDRAVGFHHAGPCTRYHQSRNDLRVEETTFPQPLSSSQYQMDLLTSTTRGI